MLKRLDRLYDHLLIQRGRVNFFRAVTVNKNQRAMNDFYVGVRSVGEELARPGAVRTEARLNKIKSRLVTCLQTYNQHCAQHRVSVGVSIIKAQMDIQYGCELDRAQVGLFDYLEQQDRSTQAQLYEYEAQKSDDPRRSSELFEMAARASDDPRRSSELFERASDVAELPREKCMFLKRAVEANPSGEERLRLCNQGMRIASKCGNKKERAYFLREGARYTALEYSTSLTMRAYQLDPFGTRSSFADLNQKIPRTTDSKLKAQLLIDAVKVAKFLKLDEKANRLIDQALSIIMQDNFDERSRGDLLHNLKRGIEENTHAPIEKMHCYLHVANNPALSDEQRQQWLQSATDVCKDLGKMAGKDLMLVAQELSDPSMRAHFFEHLATVATDTRSKALLLDEALKLLISETQASKGEEDFSGAVRAYADKARVENEKLKLIPASDKLGRGVQCKIVGNMHYNQAKYMYFADQQRAAFSKEAILNTLHSAESCYKEGGELCAHKLLKCQREIREIIRSDMAAA